MYSMQQQHTETLFIDSVHHACVVTHGCFVSSINRDQEQRLQSSSEADTTNLGRQSNDTNLYPPNMVHLPQTHDQRTTRPIVTGSGLAQTLCHPQTHQLQETCGLCQHHHSHQKQQQQQQQQQHLEHQLSQSTLSGEAQTEATHHGCSSDTAQTYRRSRALSPTMHALAPKKISLNAAMTHGNNCLRGSQSAIPPLGKGHALLPLLTMILAVLGAACGQNANITSYVVRPQDKNVTEGKTVVLDCSLRNLQSSVYWTKSSIVVATNREVPGFYSRYSVLGQDEPGGVSIFNLQIRDVEMEDEGIYECQVSVTLRAQAILSVNVPPQRPYIRDKKTTVLPVEENKVNRIECHANRGKPAADITWHMNGQRLTRGVSTTKNANDHYIDTVGTVLLNVTRSFASKRLECQAKTEFMTVPYRTFVTLDVQYAPNITMTTNITGRPLKEHDYVQFRCSGDANPQDVIWRWYRDGEPIRGAQSTTYVIHAITPDYNENAISCEATNDVGSTRQDTHLKVQYGAIIKEITAVVGADVGKSATLFCQADGNPAPMVTWRRKDRVGGALSSQRADTLSVDNTLTIDLVTRDSFGWYECTAAVQGFPSKTSEAVLVPNDAPTIRSEEQQKATKGKSARLECIVHSVPKPSRVTWSRAGTGEITAALHSRFQQELIEIKYGVKSVLHIQAVRSEDFGFYNCTVENAYGIDTARLELVEKNEYPITIIIIAVIAGLIVIFVIGLVCVLYRRCKNEEPAGSVLGSYADTDSSSDKTGPKKREKADSPTLMSQFRQGYNKDIYRFSSDYDDMPIKEIPGKPNNNGYGYYEPFERYSDHPVYDGEYVHRGDDLMPDRFEPMYPSANDYNMRSFRVNNLDRVSPPSTLTRLTPMHMSNSKLATDV